MATDASIPRAAARSVSDSDGRLALMGLVGTAGLIHLVASVEHLGAEWSLAAFFLLVGAGQVAAAWLVHRDPRDERLLTVVAVASVAIALLWVFSRTTGVPFGPGAGEVQAVGVGDTIATLLELGFAALAWAVIRRGEAAVAWLGGGMGVRLTFAVLSLALMLAAVGGHEH
ncbi:MAG TPA: hypothetical protein VNT54_15080 [Solirubrobacteraceae bacterium]|nr:hypothetical protein [Solirubrobacteraceae bacterium]